MGRITESKYFGITLMAIGIIIAIVTYNRTSFPFDIMLYSLGALFLLFGFVKHILSKPRHDRRWIVRIFGVIFLLLSSLCFTYGYFTALARDNVYTGGNFLGAIFVVIGIGLFLVPILFKKNPPVK